MKKQRYNIVLSPLARRLLELIAEREKRDLSATIEWLIDEEWRRSEAGKPRTKPK